MFRWIKGVLVIATVLALALPAQADPTTIRPLSDFLSKQGQTGGPNGPPTFVVPDPNFLGWNTNFTKPPVYFAGVDYAGLAPEAYSADKGPTFDGTVIERSLANGRAEVTVILHTKGANVWVIQFDLNSPIDFQTQVDLNPTLFGHRPRDVAKGAGQALGDSLLHVVFTNSAPGAPLPDLLVLDPNAGQELKFVAISVNAQGPLTPDFGVAGGTPGKCTIVQTGLLEVQLKQLSDNFKGTAGDHSRVAFDGFPVENIHLQVVGE